jgi:acyl carrier protein
VLLSLVVAVEDRFRIVLADDDAATTRTLEDLARLVAKRASPEVLP